MPVTSLHVQGCTRVERHAVVGIVEDAIREVGGWILDFHQYSNISLVLELEIPPWKYEDLLERLRRGGIGFGAVPELMSDEADDAVLGTLQITFIHDEPDLHIPTSPLASHRTDELLHPHARH